MYLIIHQLFQNLQQLQYKFINFIDIGSQGTSLQSRFKCFLVPTSNLPHLDILKDFL